MLGGDFNATLSLQVRSGGIGGVENLCDIRPLPKVKPPRTWSWSPPTSGLLKCNVDKAYKGNPCPSGMGGIIRDENEKFWGTFLSFLGMAGCMKWR